METDKDTETGGDIDTKTEKAQHASSFSLAKSREKREKKKCNRERNAVFLFFSFFFFFFFFFFSAFLESDFSIQRMISLVLQEIFSLASLRSRLDSGGECG